MTRPSLPLLLAALLAGCNPGHDASSEHAATTDEHAGTAHTDLSSTGQPHATTTGETGDAHATTGETGHPHATTGETGDEHPTGTTHTPGSETSGGAADPAAAYCECMLVYCHDDYHGTWGEDHEQSEAMCEAEANALPSVGAPATRGASIECRTHHCDLARSDPAACASAIGGGACQA